MLMSYVCVTGSFGFVYLFASFSDGASEPLGCLSADNVSFNELLTY